MYAKIINGVFTVAPRKIQRDGMTVFNPTGEMLAEDGWKPVIESVPEEPPAGYHYVPEYTEQNDSIVQSWTLSEEISDAAALAIIQGVEE